MESVKKSIDKRELHKREYDSWLKERQMQTIEEKVDMSKALDANLVDTKSNGIESEKQDISNKSRNDIDADDADIRPIYNEEQWLRWKQTGRNFKTVVLRWVPTGNIFTSSTTKIDNEPTNGSNEDITNQYECEHTLDVSA
nr:hypothetical protein [Tanacetum cinerariifolium]